MTANADETSRRVIVTQHAIRRLRQRDREGARHPDPVGLIFFEVQQAFREGRTARTEPRWVTAPDRDRKRLGSKPWGGTCRFAWNEAETRCYVLRWVKSNGDGRRSWVVVTCVPRTAPAAPVPTDARPPL